VRVDLDDHDDWVRPGRAAPEREGPGSRFRTSKLFMNGTARRGSGARVSLPEGTPRFVLGMGYTERRGIGADSRMRQRTLLRAQANYNGLDGKLGRAFSFDRDGEVKGVWERTESWQDDRRYFRASLNPFDHDRIADWERFGRDFMEALQHGSHRALGKVGDGLHWHFDGLLTDADRVAGHSLDWVMSIHRETGRTHTHALIRGVVGNDDLYIEPGATKDLWKVGRGVASMDHHVGMSLDRSREIDLKVTKEIRRDIALEGREVRRRELDLEIG